MPPIATKMTTATMPNPTHSAGIRETGSGVGVVVGYTIKVGVAVGRFKAGLDGMLITDNDHYYVPLTRSEWLES